MPTPFPDVCYKVMCRIHRRLDRPLASGPGTGVYCELPAAPGAEPTDGDSAVDEAAQADPTVLPHLIPMIRFCARPVMFSPCLACQQLWCPARAFDAIVLTDENDCSICFLSADSLCVRNCAITEHFSHTDDKEYSTPVFQGALGVCIDA